MHKKAVKEAVGIVHGVFCDVLNRLDNRMFWQGRILWYYQEQECMHWQKKKKTKNKGYMLLVWEDKGY